MPAFSACRERLSALRQESQSAADAAASSQLSSFYDGNGPRLVRTAAVVLALVIVLVLLVAL